jgi:hypothetical protein
MRSAGQPGAVARWRQAYWRWEPSVFSNTGAVSTCRLADAEIGRLFQMFGGVYFPGLA